jgi:hypothetical protein
LTFAKQLATLSLIVGLTIAYVLWASNFADYMYLEDLGLEDSDAAVALRSSTQVERTLLGTSLTLIVAGFVAWLVIGILWLRNRPQRFNKVVRS